eukprot:scaffold4089_cov136-Isochrysis_galbana.AAC.5
MSSAAASRRRRRAVLQPLGAGRRGCTGALLGNFPTRRGAGDGMLVRRWMSIQRHWQIVLLGCGALRACEEAPARCQRRCALAVTREHISAVQPRRAAGSGPLPAQRRQLICLRVNKITQVAQDARFGGQHGGRV